MKRTNSPSNREIAERMAKKIQASPNTSKATIIAHFAKRHNREESSLKAALYRYLRNPGASDQRLLLNRLKKRCSWAC